MKDNIIVTVMTRYGEFYAGFDMDSLLVDRFKPLKTVDEDNAIFGALNGEVPVESRGVVMEAALREGAAEELAMVLTKHIIKAMANSDTHNGYKKWQSCKLS